MALFRAVVVALFMRLVLLAIAVTGRRVPLLTARLLTFAVPLRPIDAVRPARAAVVPVAYPR